MSKVNSILDELDEIVNKDTKKSTAKMHDFSELAWNVTEPEYRKDQALSYSTLAKFYREGYNGLPTLFDRVETPSLSFGSAVDALITGGEKEFNDNFIVFDIPKISDTIKKIVDHLFQECNGEYKSFSHISSDKILDACQTFEYGSNWKPETRVRLLGEKGGADYYNALVQAIGRKVLSVEDFERVNSTVVALQDSPASHWYFGEKDTEDVKRYYQLKFKDEIEGIEFRGMMDLIIVDYKNKKIYPCDLKTSSKKEWEFQKSFLDWSYSIQANCYWHLINQAISRDEYFKYFELMPFRFIVCNGDSLCPLVWEWKYCAATGPVEITSWKTLPYFVDVARELKYYLDNPGVLPIGIKEEPNDIMDWLRK